MPWPDSSHASTRLEPTLPHTSTHSTIEHRPGHALLLRLGSVLTLCSLGSDCAATYLWFPPVMTAFQWFFFFDKFCSLKSALWDFITGTGAGKKKVKNRFLVNRKRLDHMAVHTEICSHTSAGSQSQGGTMLCLKRQHSICLTAGRQKNEQMLHYLYRPTPHTLTCKKFHLFSRWPQ